jgi:DNA polymerase-1
VTSLPDGTLILDIETHSAAQLYTMEPEQFVRLMGFWLIGHHSSPQITTDLDELRWWISKASVTVGHNVLSFDLPAVYGATREHWSPVPVQLADARRVLDTWTYSVLVNPMPWLRFTDRTGVTRSTIKAGGEADISMAKRWHRLDEQAHQLGVPGKSADLAALAYRHGSPFAGNKQARTDDGYGRIPTDDPEYRDYLIGDLYASRAVAEALIARHGWPTNYAWREMRIEARKAALCSNGFRVNVPWCTARVTELESRKNDVVRALQSQGMPATGKAPWTTTAGKAVVLKVLAGHGITPETRPDWPRGKTGPSLGGEVLTSMTKGTAAEGFGTVMAELQGQRPLAAQALATMHADGFAHPEVTMLQRSGRLSTTKPGLTTYTARGPGAVEKSAYRTDTDDEVLLDFDLSNADGRIVSAYSGDTAYATRFEPGQNGHLINAIAAWGRATVTADDASQAFYCQLAKPLGHGWNYGAGPRGLVTATGVDIGVATAFCDGMAQTFPQLVAWQDQVRQEARLRHRVLSHWGRYLPVMPNREHTQAPAQLGQNGTREIWWDGVLDMPLDHLRRLKVNVHDAGVFSVPRDEWEDWSRSITGYMTRTIEPAGGLRMTFSVGHGKPGNTWYEASH